MIAQIALASPSLRHKNRILGNVRLEALSWAHRMEGMIERVRAEFLEMPGLRLTAAQIERLCGLEQAVCASVIEALVGEKFLCANQDGTFARLTEGVLRPRPAKAELNPPSSRRQAS